MSLKKQFIKNQLKLRLVSNRPGVIKIKIGILPRLDEKYQPFGQYVVDAIKILQGITNVDVDFSSGNVTIEYDSTLLSDRQVMAWINAVIDVAIDNMNLITTYWESNLQYVMDELKTKLEAKETAILAN